MHHLQVISNDSDRWIFQSLNKKCSDSFSWFSCFLFRILKKMHTMYCTHINSVYKQTLLETCMQQYMIFRERVFKLYPTEIEHTPIVHAHLRTDKLTFKHFFPMFGLNNKYVNTKYVLDYHVSILPVEYITTRCNESVYVLT